MTYENIDIMFKSIPRRSERYLSKYYCFTNDLFLLQTCFTFTVSPNMLLHILQSDNKFTKGSSWQSLINTMALTKTIQYCYIIVVIITITIFIPEIGSKLACSGAHLLLVCWRPPSAGTRRLLLITFRVTCYLNVHIISSYIP